MQRRLFTVLLLGLLVVLAGCSGAGGNGDDGSTPAASAGDGTEMATPTDDGGATPMPAVEDGDWERSNAQWALESAGSFTNVWTWRTNADGGGEMTFTNRVDVANERAHNTLEIDVEETSVVDNYHGDGVQYTRYAAANGGQSTYVAREVAFDEASFAWDYGYAYEESAYDDWTLQGSDTYDGVPVRRYVYDASADLLASQQVPQTEFEVTSSRLELLVDQNGVPRYQHYEMAGVDDDGKELWYEWELTTSDIGSTTVVEPDWIETARQQSP